MDIFIESVEMFARHTVKYYSVDDAIDMVLFNLTHIYQEGAVDLINNLSKNGSIRDGINKENEDAFWTIVQKNEKFLSFTNNLYENGYQHGHRDGSTGVPIRNDLDSLSSYSSGYLDGHSDGTTEAKDE